MEDIIEKAKTLFIRQLVDRAGKRGPYRLECAVEDVSSLPRESTAAIFYSRGPEVWLAYHLAKSTHAILYESQQEHEKILDAFEELPIENRERVANSLQGTKVCSTIQPSVDRLRLRPKPPKRPRLDNDGQSSYEDFTNLGYSSETRQTPTPATAARASAETADVGTAGETSGALALNSAALAAPLQSEMLNGNEVVTHPRTKMLFEIFPHYLCGAIKKVDNDRADVTMTFPTDHTGRIGCLMSLNVLPNKIQQVAFDLFRTRLEMDGTLRYVLQENGATMHPNPELRLQGASEDAIRQMFGVRVGTAIKESLIRNEELRQGLLFTSCVTLMVTRYCHEACVLSLNLETGHGFRLKEELFNQK